MAISDKGLLVGALVALGVALLASSSHAASSGSGAPTPGPGAKVETFANPVAGTGMPTLKRTSWPVAADASGQRAGTMILLQNAANPNDWVLSFRGDAGGAGVLAYAQTPNAGLLAQGAAAGQ